MSEKAVTVLATIMLNGPEIKDLIKHLMLAVVAIDYINSPNERNDYNLRYSREDQRQALHGLNGLLRKIEDAGFRIT